MKKLLLILLFIFLISFVFVKKNSADELDDLGKQINDLTTALNMSVNATKPLESELRNLQKQIVGIKNRVSLIEDDVAQKKKIIDNGYKELAKQQVILNRTIRDFYIKSYYNSPLLIFLSAPSASEITQVLAYQKAATDQDKSIITNIALSINDLEIQKKALEEEQLKLAFLKTTLDEQSAKLDKVVSGAKAYQSSLTSQIAQLSAKQQQLLAQKLGSLGLPTSAYTTKGGCSSDLTNGKDPGFSPRIAFFTYGVPHRVGMSQYGAKGRADAGQSYNDILSFYFPNTQLSDVGTSTNIHVTGSNEYGQGFDDNWNIEEYVKHIYEIPTDWHPQALRAQAIAARSYALAYTNNGSGSICPSQQCQVVKKELNSDAWVQAVNDTAGKVLISGGSPIKAWFSSTAGGYTFSSGDVWGSSTSYTRNSFDGQGSANSFSDLLNNAYDKSSPWFYCDWGGRSSYANTAWLKPEELADIVNSILLVQNDSSADSHILQTDKNDPETWSEDKVKQELTKYRTPFNSITSGNVDADFGSGRTTRVYLSGDGGSVDFPADAFKKYFNLRAPSNINIVGPLYNVEKR